MAFNKRQGGRTRLINTALQVIRPAPWFLPRRKEKAARRSAATKLLVGVKLQQRGLGVRSACRPRRFRQAPAWHDRTGYSIRRCAMLPGWRARCPRPPAARRSACRSALRRRPWRCAARRLSPGRRRRGSCQLNRHCTLQHLTHHMQRASLFHAQATPRSARPTYREEDRSEDTEAEARHVDVVARAVDQQRKPAEDVREEDVQPCARVTLVVEAQVQTVVPLAPAPRALDRGAPAGRIARFLAIILVVLYVGQGWRVAAEQGAFAALVGPTQSSPVPRKCGGGRAPPGLRAAPMNSASNDGGMSEANRAGSAVKNVASRMP